MSLLCGEPDLLAGQREAGNEGLMMCGAVPHRMHNGDGVQSPDPREVGAFGGSHGAAAGERLVQCCSPEGLIIRGESLGFLADESAGTEQVPPEAEHESGDEVARCLPVLGKFGPCPGQGVPGPAVETYVQTVPFGTIGGRQPVVQGVSQRNLSIAMSASSAADTSRSHT